MGNVVVFGNQKGGVGKSTLAILYALWLADVHRHSVCVIDLDTQGNASKTLHPFRTGVQAVDLFADAVAPVVPVRAPGAQRTIALIAATKKLADIELAKPETVVPAFRRSVAQLAQRFETVVIDTPPALGLRMSAALIAATDVVCPIELEEYSIDGVTDMLKTVFGVRQRYNPRLELAGIVLNRFNAHSVRQKTAMQHLAASYAEFVVPARISTRSAIPEALAEGKAVWELAKSSAREASAEVKEVFTLLQRRIERSQQIVAQEVAA
ncbi:ParA family protein [Variovorax ureilyticus]|uniref:ParA family protein n=1 Tax=Variovorax ureilyticus TaxID=1836198 RepID=A0ABU8VQM9_9BURK